jgi:hypothetical protein
LVFGVYFLLYPAHGAASGSAAAAAASPRNARRQTSRCAAGGWWSSAQRGAVQCGCGLLLMCGPAAGRGGRRSGGAGPGGRSNHGVPLAVVLRTSPHPHRPLTHGTTCESVTACCKKKNLLHEPASMKRTRRRRPRHAESHSCSNRYPHMIGKCFRTCTRP